MSDSSKDPKSHPQYQYWRDRVYLKNMVLLASGEEFPVPKMRHEFTNYDDLLNSSEFQKLEGPERVAAYHALHYTATIKPLKHREFQLAEQRNALLEKRAKFELAQRELRRLFDQKAIDHKELVRYKIKLEEINRSLICQSEAQKAASIALKAENIQLREDCKRIQLDYEAAIAKIIELERQLAKEQTHRAKLAKKNQSMGGRIGAYITNYNKQKQKSEDLQKQVWALKGKLQKIQKHAQDKGDSELHEIARF
jgi:chromosome segregation ATPase